MGMFDVEDDSDENRYDTVISALRSELAEEQR